MTLKQNETIKPTSASFNSSFSFHFSHADHVEAGAGVGVGAGACRCRLKARLNQSYDLTCFSQPLLVILHGSFLRPAVQRCVERLENELSVVGVGEARKVPWQRFRLCLYAVGYLGLREVTKVPL